ncbi:MAG TPA: proton-conducting transporter membrane subunit, partial [Patescibacteria group bacterium]|nr:proton-conducting transporter membrane subunit [Patescibacteria group bacterium]
MMQYILSSNGFFLLIGSFLLAALGAILGKSKDRFANAWTSTFLIIGACIGIVLAVLALPVGQGFSFVFKTYFVPISVRIDGLSAFFVFTISLLVLASAIYGIGYVRQFYTHYSVGVLGFFLSIFIASLYLVVTANNGIYFLLVWELMALSSYFLVIYEHKEAENLRAGLLYFIMTHVGTAFLLLAFLLLYRTTGSFDFDIIRANAGSIPAVAKSLIFVFALLGLGTKAGIIPLHMWLPEAHPAAPSHVSALMSGVMIKTAIYMMIRLFLDVLSNFPAWWGIVVLLLGAISSLLGVLYALSSHDLKRLLAFHSVENIGIILLGLGSAMVFLSYGNTTLAVVGAAAALFHTINHAVFKGLLFLGAGSVVMQTGTRNMEEYGGLIKKMPYTAFFFLVGAVAISA